MLLAASLAQLGRPALLLAEVLGSFGPLMLQFGFWAFLRGDD